MSKPLPVNYKPDIGDVVIGKYAKLNGSFNPLVVIGYDSFDYHDDCAVAVDVNGDMHTIELRFLKYVINPIKGLYDHTKQN